MKFSRISLLVSLTVGLCAFCAAGVPYSADLGSMFGGDWTAGGGCCYSHTTMTCSEGVDGAGNNISCTGGVTTVCTGSWPGHCEVLSPPTNTCSSTSATPPQSAWICDDTYDSTCVM